MGGINKKKLLVVEDCEIANQTLRQMLADAYETEHLKTIGSFRERLASQGEKPDLLILDLVLNGKNLFDEISPTKLAQMLDGYRWLVVSAHLDALNMDRAFQAGATDCIDKLQGSTAMRARIDRAVRGSFTGDMVGFKINNKNRFVYMKHYRTERSLSPLELAIINCLFEARGRKATREQILWEIFETKVGTTLERHISSLRKVLSTLPGVAIDTIQNGESISYALQIEAGASDLRSTRDLDG